MDSIYLYDKHVEPISDRSAAFTDGASRTSLRLIGRDSCRDRTRWWRAREATVTAVPDAGAATRFAVRDRLETPREREYLRHGSVLPYALRDCGALRSEAIHHEEEQT
jgi:aconitase A